MATYVTERIQSIATVSFRPPSTPSGLFRPEYYTLSVTPEPIEQPSTNIVPFVFDVTIHHYTEYTITITATSCGGQNSSSTIILSGKLCPGNELSFNIMMCMLGIWVSV